MINSAEFKDKKYLNFFGENEKIKQIVKKIFLKKKYVMKWKKKWYSF
jgi:hypothetical protein